MEWEITIHNDNKYIEVVTAGVGDKDGSIEMVKSIRETMRHNRIVKAIIDHRNLTDVSGSVVDVYQRPKLFKLLGVILNIKIAEIINVAHLEHFSFFETVCQNNGFTFSIFYEKENALEWLLE